MPDLRRLWGRWKLRRCAAVGRGSVALGAVWIHGEGTVRVGEGVILDGTACPIELHAVEKESVIELADGVVLDGGSVEAVASVRIGPRTRIGRFSRVLDNHFHPLTGDRRIRPPSAPVTVGAGVDIRAHAYVLAGCQVGDGAVIHAGTVASHAVVPAGGSLRGNPAVPA